MQTDKLFDLSPRCEHCGGVATTRLGRWHLCEAGYRIVMSRLDYVMPILTLPQTQFDDWLDTSEVTSGLYDAN